MFIFFFFDQILVLLVELIKIVFDVRLCRSLFLSSDLKVEEVRYTYVRALLLVQL
jgi:hypothetical protein